MLKIVEANPMLIKSLGRYLYPIPLIEFIIFKYWGYIDNKKSYSMIIIGMNPLQNIHHVKYWKL